MKGVELTIHEVHRFHMRIERTSAGHGCWIWTGEKNNKGYGRFLVYRDSGRVRLLAHRVSLFLGTGLDPEVVRHDCDNPPCVNPTHLLHGTQADNMQDALKRGRMNTWGLAEFHKQRDAEIQRRIALQRKSCKGCDTEKDFSEFPIDKSARDGRHSRCLACHSARRTDKQVAA